MGTHACPFGLMIRLDAAEIQVKASQMPLVDGVANTNQLQSRFVPGAPACQLPPCFERFPHHPWLALSHGKGLGRDKHHLGPLVTPSRRAVSHVDNPPWSRSSRRGAPCACQHKSYSIAMAKRCQRLGITPQHTSCRWISECGHLRLLHGLPYG